MHYIPSITLIRSWYLWKDYKIEEGEEGEGATLGVNIFGIGADGADVVRQKENAAEEDEEEIFKNQQS